MGAGLGDKTCLITDGRFSGASRGFIIGGSSQTRLCSTDPIPGHVTPEAHVGGPIALVEDGDRVAVDATMRTIEWLVDAATQEARKQKWEQKGERPYTVKRGVLLRYARDVAVSGFPLDFLLLMNVLAGQCWSVLRLNPVLNCSAR